jgi:cyclophilin family peptidyl-prolyl cis-trans isomerase
VRFRLILSPAGLVMFFIRLDNKHVVFGKVIDGMLTVCPQTTICCCQCFKHVYSLLHYFVAMKPNLTLSPPVLLHQVRKMENVPVGPNSKPLRPVIVTEVSSL